jgi:hypothetical protein
MKMKKLLLTAAVLAIFATPAMAEKTDFTFEQTAVVTNSIMVGVSYILRNNLDRKYKDARITCSLFLNGVLVGTVMDLFVHIEPLARVHGRAASGLNGPKPDAAECSIQVRR